METHFEELKIAKILSVMSFTSITKYRWFVKQKSPCGLTGDD